MVADVGNGIIGAYEVNSNSFLIADTVSHVEIRRINGSSSSSNRDEGIKGIFIVAERVDGTVSTIAVAKTRMTKSLPAMPILLLSE